MSENSIADVISALSSNKEFENMIERVKEGGDLSSIISEVSSLLSSSYEPQNINSNDDFSTSKDESVDEAQEEKSTTNEADNNETSNEASDIIKSILAGNEASNKQKRSQDENVENGLGSLIGGFLPLFAKSISSSSSLLIALKPYLSQKRCDLIDNVIKLSKLAGIVSLIK